MKKLIQKVKVLNEATSNFAKALAILEKNITKTTDIETHFWRIKNSFGIIQKEIMKQLDKESINDEFKNITKKFKRK